MFFRTVTLGCKVNQYETEYVRQGLLQAGYREATDDERADLCIVNTCTVTLEGDYKSRKIIRALARENPAAEIVVMGCYATRASEEVAALPGVCEVVTDKRQLPDLLMRLGVTSPPTGIASFGRLHRAYVKVQDGCRAGCSYCIIPQVRPVLVSRPVNDVLDEVRRLADHGHLEIVLTGIHLGHYGLDFRRDEDKTSDLAGLVRRILELDGTWRVRISSLEAAELTPELLELMAGHPERLCPHLHLPMQSGADAVLARMRRKPIGRFIDRCQAAYERLDRPALTTDVIVGFPGETEAEFEETCRVVERMEFAKVHVFKFSARAGTPAATMPDQVPYPVKHRRAMELGEIARRLREAYCQSIVGHETQVLVESAPADQPGLLLGTSERYVTVEMPDRPGRLHHLVRVCPDSASGERLRVRSSENETSTSR